MGLTDLDTLTSKASLSSVAPNPFISTVRGTSFTSGRFEMISVTDIPRRDSRENLPAEDLMTNLEVATLGQPLQLPLGQPRSRRVSTTARHLHLAPRSRPESPDSPTRNQNVNRSVGATDDDAFEPPVDARLGPVRSGFGSDDSGETEVRPCCSAEANRMRWKIRFFFMDPIQKWRMKHQFPWKLFLQVVKIIFVTIQLVTFGNDRYRFATFLKQNTVAFRHLLLEDWNDPDIPPQVYPNTGLYAVYIQEDFYKRIDFAVNNFIDIRDIAVGTYQPEAINGSLHFRFCKREFMQAHIFPQNHSFIYDSGIEETCLLISLAPYEIEKFSIRNYLDQHNASVGFDRMVDAHVLFKVKSVALNSMDPDDEPACYIFDISIRFDNSGHNGQISVFLDLDPHVVPCAGTVLFNDGQSVLDILIEVLDVIVLITCSISFVLCLRALSNAESLKKTVITFFLTQYNYSLTSDERFDFLNFWYVMIVINDIMIIVGTIIKMRINVAVVTELPLYNACGMLLGVGNLLVWVGILRYFGFFRTYNILILTLKRAVPNVVRYLVCIMLIFFGFSFCGWIVLGPYHVKFQTFHSTTETIFSLINGDDMFATFAILPFQNTLIWYFSRVYLYSFISIFTYVVLSLMISLIMDAYGTVKDFYHEGGPLSRLMQFVKEPSTAPAYECPEHRREETWQDSADVLKRPLVRWYRWLRHRWLGELDHESSREWAPHQRLVET